MLRRGGCDQPGPVFRRTGRYAAMARGLSGPDSASFVSRSWRLRTLVACSFDRPGQLSQCAGEENEQPHFEFCQTQDQPPSNRFSNQPRSIDSQTSVTDSMATSWLWASRSEPRHSVAQALTRFQRETSVAPSLSSSTIEIFLRCTLPFTPDMNQS